MEQSLSLRLEEMPEDELNVDIENCRLLHGLNINCQLEVLEYLGVNDLLQVSKLGKYFYELITKWIIGNKTMNLEVSDSSDNNDVLEAFGKSIRKIRATGSDYNFILKTIINFCSSSHLTDMQIVVNRPTLANVNAIRLLPAFTNLRKLRLDDKYGSKHMVGHLKELAAGASELKVLKVRGNNIQGEWLRTRHMKNLSELWLHTSKIISIRDLTYFIREHPKLQVFSLRGVNDIAAVGNCLAKYCKDLKKFFYEDISDHYEDKFYNENREIYVASNRYGFLSSFLNLNSVMLSFKYFNYPLMSLISRYNVKELKININLSSITNQCKFKHSIDLQTVEVDIRQFSDILVEREPCNLTLKYIVDIVSQMKNVEKITLCSTKIVTNLHSVLELVPNIRTFSISNVEFLHLPVEIRKIARMLRDIHQKRNHQNLIHLIVNEAQLRELEIYEKERSISASVDPPLPKRRKFF